MNHVLKEMTSTNRTLQTLAYIDPTRPLHPRLMDELAGFLLKELGAK
jgi:hypothetical protein